jgi:hypothetical protein
MTDERTTAYLLNELTEDEAQQFEEQCFSQAAWPDEELESAEEDLIQAYIKNELSPERHRRFEEIYLTTEARKERLLLARSFLQVVCPIHPTKVPWQQKVWGFLKSFALSPQFAVPRFATLVVTIGLIATLIWFAFQTKAPHTFAPLSLSISSDNRAESSQTPSVRLPLTADALRISLALPEAAQQSAMYRVQWEDLKGPLENLDVEKQDANSISVIIPADKLTQGQYVLKLFRKKSDGTDDRVPGSYLFNVE